MQPANKEVRIIQATKVMSRKVRVAAYCRVSTDKADQLNSFFAQMKYYSDYVRENYNMILVDIYADEGITGTEIEKRDEMKRLIRDCQHKKIDRVVTKSVQRFARNALECIETLRLMKSCGVTVLFENDHIDTAKMNSELILYIKSAFAENEALAASRRMSTSVRMKMENGTITPSASPYGYRVMGNSFRIVPEEAEVVRKIYAMYLQGKGFSVISKALEKEIPTKKWDRNTIRYILQNEKYIGDSLWQKKYTPPVLPLRQHNNHGEMPKYYCTQTHEAIVSKTDYDAVQALMQQRSEKHCKDYTRKPAFFKHKITCRHCGWSYKESTSKTGQRWICRKKGLTNETCPSRIYTTQQLQKAFIRMFHILKQNQSVVLDETISQLQAFKTKSMTANNPVIEIDEALASYTQKNRLYHQMYVNGSLDEITYLEKTDTIKGHIAELRSQRLRIITDDEEQLCIEELRQLRKIIGEYTGYLWEMDEHLFDQTVKQIIAEEDGSLSFLLHGDLELKVIGE